MYVFRVIKRAKYVRSAFSATAAIHVTNDKMHQLL